jgi:hypothetical protein
MMDHGIKYSLLCHYGISYIQLQLKEKLDTIHKWSLLSANRTGESNRMGHVLYKSSNKQIEEQLVTNQE